MQPRIITAFLIALLSMSVLMPTLAQASDKNAILNRMKQRYPQLLQAQRAGQIGEGWNGYTAVPPQAGQVPGNVQQIVAAENQDRKQLYAILAKELNVSVATVAANNRTRLYEKAESGIWLQKPNGSWVKK